MILDTSAILAILFGESDAEIYARAIAEAESRRISAANFVEAAIVVEAQTAEIGSRQFDAFFRRAAIAIEPLTEEQAHIARQAYADFGKGRHPAALNLGDCFAYALSKAAGEPLLFKGRDFHRTDVIPALTVTPPAPKTRRRH
jgi:ribonuclease VapC